MGLKSVIIMAPWHLFHYTSEEREKIIRREGVIRRSWTSDRDAMFGEGVYLTQMNPDEFEKDEIAKNNWGPSGYKKSRREGKADAHIRLEIPVNDRNISKCPSGERNIFLYSGDMEIDKYSPQSGRNDEWGLGQSLAVVAGVSIGAALLGGGLALLGSYLSQDKCEKCGERFEDRHSLERHSRLCRNY